VGLPCGFVDVGFLLYLKLYSPHYRVNSLLSYAFACSFAFSRIPLPSSLNFSSRCRYLWFKYLWYLTGGTGRVYQVPMPGLLYTTLGTCYLPPILTQGHSVWLSTNQTPANRSPLQLVALGGLSLRHFRYKFIFICHSSHYTRRFC